MLIDHVLFGVRDLPAANRWFRSEYGLETVGGGEHPSWGTANAIIAVGGEGIAHVASPPGIYGFTLSLNGETRRVGS